MPRLSAAIFMAAFTCAPCPVLADEENPYASKPKTQQDIIREQEQACRNLKGEARSECLNNYVGPSHEKSGGAWKRPANPPRPQGRK